ncbi:uncharacterized protein LAJ45_02807 [Morchella importuna]|uniref:Glutaredoxin n=1 Tax=Morchella conica CCBAS932 TaxID=1392247 RepID=A0A3N4L1K2_9PEZI|nr:uncharacterized protein LAJ45_02807 [Morchella importuna]KAH8153220.1 hypothetical protein LAJ45_02807 [Morchella importuna]RPB15382.1 glutaredoxin [Morchella conica CCBAS932]
MVSAATKQKVQGIIDSNPVAVFSKSYCPYCRATKETLTSLGAKFHVLELDQIDDGAEIQDALQELTGQRTVPQNFIGQEFIGGNSDLQARKGELPKLLKAAGAV